MAQEKKLYDLVAATVTYEGNYVRGSRTLPWKVVLNRIPDADLRAYDKSLVRPIKTDADGATLFDWAPNSTEIELFDKYFVSINWKMTGPGSRTEREEVLAKIPSALKRSVIREGVGQVLVVPEVVDAKQEISFDDVAGSEVVVKIKTPVDSEWVVMEHRMDEPSAEHEQAYQKATVGRMKALPGRQRPEYIVVEDFGIYGKLYDELVRGVKGYGESGVEVALGDEDERRIKLAMIPYYHKKVVVRQLFGSSTVRQAEEEQFF